MHCGLYNAWKRLFANSAWTLNSTFPEYMTRNKRSFYTFNEIMPQTFDKTIRGITIFTNIEIIIM